MPTSSGSQTTTQKTELPKWYTDATKDNIKFANTASDNLSQPYMGNTVAGLDGLQKQAIAGAGSNVGSTNAGFQQASQGALGAMGYKPQQVNTGFQAQQIGTSYQPQNVNAGSQGYNYRPDQVQAGQGSYDYQPGQVDGGSFLSGDVGAYMSPYLQNVEQAARTNMGQQLQQGINQIGDAAIGSRAFGGSRQGVREGVAISDAARQMGDFSANLRNQAFSQAQGMMESDMSRGLQAGLANQQTGMSNAQFGANIGMQNIGNNLQAGLANQQAGMGNAQFGANLGSQNLDRNMQGQLANQQAGYQGAALNQQGQLANQNAWYQQGALNQQGALANQSAGLQGAQLNNQAAQNLGALTSQGQDAYLQSLNSAMAAGGMNQQYQQQLLDQQQSQYNAMRNVPLDQLNIRMAPLQGVQLGSTMSQKTPTSGNGFLSLLGGAGALIGGLGQAGIISDKNEKTNIRKVGKDGLTGLDLYSYDYKDDVAHAKQTGQPMGPKRVGPMAQDIEKAHPGSTRKVGGKRIVHNLGFGG
jgi:hypothetical protein